MKVVIAWLVGLAMGAGGLLAWGVYDKHLDVTFHAGPTAPSGTPHREAAAPLGDENAPTPMVDMATLAPEPAVGAPVPLEAGETMQSKFGAASVGESVAPGGSSIERGKVQ